MAAGTRAPGRARQAGVAAGPGRTDAYLPSMTDAPAADPTPAAEAPGAAPGKRLTPEARRALEEAAERRAATETADRAAERGGPAGPEPTRYGDWERKGVAVDFS